MTTHLLSLRGGARACGAVVVGAEGHIVDVDAALSTGGPGFSIDGLPDTALREARDRVRAAVINSGLPWPAQAIIVTLLPAGLPKQGTALDLAVAVAVLTAAGDIPAGAADRCLLAAELGLDGRLRPVPGVLPMVAAAAAAGCARAIVAPGNADEAEVLPGIAVTPCPDLLAARAWLRGDTTPRRTGLPGQDAPQPDAPPATGVAVPRGVRLAVETSAAGRHHLCLTGPPGSGATAAAEALAAVLPPLRHHEVLEVSAIHSAAGLLGPGHCQVTRPPYLAPHHTTARPAITGGGTRAIRPGAAALAHHGVLYLENAPEFGRDVLAALDQPLRTGEIVIARAGITVRFPARFTLVTSMASCPCGDYGQCSCTVLQARRYRDRLTRQLGGHIAIGLHLSLPGGDGGREVTELVSADRIAAARERARHRLRGTSWQANGDIPSEELHRYQPSPGGQATISRALDLGQISYRTRRQLIRVAWTLADLAGQPRPGKDECAQALKMHLAVTR